MDRRTIRQEGAPLASLQGSQYGFSSINYPIDIENISHTILFNINVQESSKDLSGISVAAGEPPTAAREMRTSTSETPRYQQTKANQKLGLTRRTRRVARAISLYVPETVVFDSKQQYESPSLLDKLGLGGAAAATLASKSQENFGTLATLAGLGAAGLVAGALVGVGPLTAGLRAIDAAQREATSLAKTGAQILGFALNPIIEVMYQSPQLRTFNFDFVFAPRSSEEADKVWEIIHEFRRHSAPEFLDGIGGVILVPPSDFDITFMRKGENGFVENTNMPRITSCVCEDVQVDYGAAGQFATYVDGMPVQIRMRLSFKELDIITREKIDKGY